MPHAPTPSYAEQLSVPLRWWAIATMFTASVLLAFLVAVPPTVAYATTAAVALVSVVLLSGYGAARVSVAEGQLRAGRATIPVRLLGAPRALDAAATRRVAGVEADARAFLLLRPYVETSVQVDVLDPDDPTPYWLVATRHPRLLVEVLTSAMESSSASGDTDARPDDRRGDRPDDRPANRPGDRPGDKPAEHLRRGHPDRAD